MPATGKPETLLSKHPVVFAFVEADIRDKPLGAGLAQLSADRVFSPRGPETPC